MYPLAPDLTERPVHIMIAEKTTTMIAEMIADWKQRHDQSMVSAKCAAVPMAAFTTAA